MRSSGPSAIGDSHLCQIGLDLMPAILAPYDQPDAGSGRTPERHRRAGVGFRRGSLPSEVEMAPDAVNDRPEVDCEAECARLELNGFIERVHPNRADAF
jgi:hypothetical protein